MVPLKWQSGVFFPSAAAAFLCGAFGCLGGALGPGVWDQLRYSASANIAFMVCVGIHSVRLGGKCS